MSLHADLLSQYKKCERHWNILFYKTSPKEPIWEALRNGPHLSIITLKSGEISLTVAEYAVSCIPYSFTVLAEKRGQSGNFHIWSGRRRGGEKKLWFSKLFPWISRAVHLVEFQVHLKVAFRASLCFSHMLFMVSIYEDGSLNKKII